MKAAGMVQGSAKYLCIFQSNIENTLSPLTERTTRQYAQCNGALFSRRAFALDVMHAAACFCDLEQTRDITKINPDFVRDGRVVVRQDVQALGFVDMRP
jgi:hypothetical protein